MLYLNLTENLMGRDPKASIEDALRVAQTLQVGVILVFNDPWLGLTIRVSPANQLDPVLAEFDALVDSYREYYANGHVSVCMPIRSEFTPTVSTDLG